VELSGAVIWQVLDPVVVDREVGGEGSFEQHRCHGRDGVEAEAASVVDLRGQVAREEQEAVEEARRHEEGWKPEAREEVLEAELVVARPAGEDPGGVEEGGDGGEGLKEGEQLEQESQAARSPARALSAAGTFSAADAVSAPAIHQRLGGGGGGGSGFGLGVGFFFSFLRE